MPAAPYALNRGMRYHEIVERALAPTDNPRFRRWFGDSQVVDGHGQPLVLYHGSLNDFHAFLPGSHFGDIEAANTRLANIHAEPSGLPRMRSHSGAVYPVYLRVENPLRIVDDAGLADGYDLRDAARDAGALTPDEYKAISDAMSPGSVRVRLFNVLAKKGYDGLVYQNTVEGAADSWVPFTASQVKSVFNTGSFDREVRAMTEAAASPVIADARFYRRHP